MPTEDERLRVRAELGDDFADVNEAKDALWQRYERDPATLDELQQAVLDAWVLSGLVGNGGFDLWVRSSGHRGEQTVRGLRLLGQTRLAATVEKALAIVGALHEADEDSRNEVVDGLAEDAFDRLDGLNQAVWDADSELEKAMAQAVRANPSLFPPQ